MALCVSLVAQWGYGRVASAPAEELRSTPEAVGAPESSGVSGSAIQKPTAAPEPDSLAALVPSEPSSGEVEVSQDGPVRSLAFGGGSNEMLWQVWLAPQAKIRWAYLLQNPPRLVIDTENAPVSGSRTIELPSESAAERARLGERDGSTRIVLDLSRVPAKVHRSGNRIRLTFVEDDQAIPPP
jgi:hypothetical protein